jgi:hypothetical protein
MVAAGAVAVRAATAIRTEILYHNRQGMVNETKAAAAATGRRRRQHDGGGDGCC